MSKPASDLAAEMLSIMRKTASSADSHKKLLLSPQRLSKLLSVIKASGSMDFPRPKNMSPRAKMAFLATAERKLSTWRNTF